MRGRVFLLFLTLLLPSRVVAAEGDTLPPPPAGWTVRELARLPGNPTRVADDGSGKRLYVLLRDGDVYRIDLHGSAGGRDVPRRVLAGSSYTGAHANEPLDVVGLAIDTSRQFYIVVNRKDTSPPIYLNR